MPRRPHALLVWIVLAAHLLLLAWWSSTQSVGGVLSAMNEPEFNRALLPTDGADVLLSDQQTARMAALARPPPTVGQVVQARTLPAPAAQTATAPRQPAKERAIRTKPSVPPAKAQATAPTTADQVVPPVPAPNPHAWVPAPEPPPPAPNPAEDAHTLHPNAATEENKEKTPPALDNKALLAINGDSDSSTWINAWPLSTRLSYKLEGQYRGPLYGQAQVQWQRTASRYQAQITVNVGLFIDMRLTSQGRITPTHLWPLAYEEDRRGKKRGARLGEQTLVLDNGSTVPRPPQLQDTASQFVQLAQDFSTGRLALAVGTVVPVTLARPGGVDEWVYDVVALETLETPLGPLAAYHLKPRPLVPARSGVMAEMWFAPSLQHLPARIRLTLNPETWLDLMLEKVAQSP